MLYRKLGKTGLSVSVLGFGAMRLPVEGATGSPTDVHDPNKPVDEKKAMPMIEYAIDHGVNYFDSAYVYHGGKSEIVLGKGLKACRDKVMIATKLPATLVKGAEDFERFFSEQLERLDTTYVDVYLLHGLHRETWDRTKDMGVLLFLDRIVSEGRARHVGFSFHDDFAVFEEIVDSYDWEFCQIQYNYYDEHAQAGKKGARLRCFEGSRDRGHGAGPGRHARRRSACGRSGPLGFGAGEEVPGGMGFALGLEPRRGVDGLKWYEHHGPGQRKHTDSRRWNQPIPSPRKSSPSWAKCVRPTRKCSRSAAPDVHTACPARQGSSYRPCSPSITTPSFSPKRRRLRPWIYNNFFNPEQRASACTECAKCEEKCPQHIPIREELKNVHQRLSRE